MTFLLTSMKIFYFGFRMDLMENLDRLVGSHSKFQYVALVTYPEIVESYNASGELAVKKVMGRIDCSHTRVGIVVRIHAETK